VSTGEGKPKEGDYRTTVFKRELDVTYNLKINSSRAFFAEINKKYPTLPFSISGFENTTAARVGVKECMTHDLITPYPVLVEKTGEYVAQFKCTVAVQQRSTVILAGDVSFTKERYESEKSLQSKELQDLVAAPLWKKEDKKKPSKKAEEEKQ
jgi:hypothetical protein